MKKGVLQNGAHALKLCNWLHPADVGAVIDRPRAIDNRPYEFYGLISEILITAR